MVCVCVAVSSYLEDLVDQKVETTVRKNLYLEGNDYRERHKIDG